MLHDFLIGLIMGWGVAIPIGPMNLEIIRRNLRHGISAGLQFGLGICSADLTYLLLLNLGALTIISHSRIMGIVGLVGAMIMAWFGYKTLRMKTPTAREGQLQHSISWHNLRDGYVLTLFSPFTILFWLSMSSQIAVHAVGSQPHSMLMIGLGVVLGTVSWMIGFNLVLHRTRHYLSAKTMHNFNLIGGVILIGFAIFGVIQAIKLF
jgi:L-lysine exporter family protein LysE/ArgO